MKELISLLKVLLWIAVVMVVVGGLLSGMHPVALVAGLGILGLSHWIVLTAFKAADKALENRRRHKGGQVR